MRREFFNVMAREGKVPDWIEAFTYGQAKASGPEQFLQLIVNVVERQQERERTPQGAQARLSGAHARARRWRAPCGCSVVGGQLLGQERQRAEQEQAHHDQ